MAGKLPTLSDVARHAGVSYATADRVVNSRGGVAPKSASRVEQAIAELGYIRNVAAANLSQQRLYRFAAILPSGPNAFFARMRAIMEDQRDRLTRDRVMLTLVDVPAFDPQALSETIGRLAGDGLDGLALVGTDDARVADAIAAARRGGMAVLTLVSDVPGAVADGYVGIDNGVAGRMAGRLIGLAHGGRPGRVLPIVGSLAARDHAERLAGVWETLSVEYPEITLAPEIEGRDRHDVVEALLAPALKQDAGITAIYSAGAGNAGLIRVLEALPAGQSRPMVALHELVPHSRRALRDGLIDIVIDQRPEDEVARALNSLRRIADRWPVPAAGPIVPAIIVKENLPPETGAALNGDTPA